MRLAGVGGCLAAAAIGALVSAQDGVSLRRIDLTITEGTNFAAAVSPDRRWIALDVLGSLWVLPFTGGDAQRLTPDTIEVAHPSWSPDSEMIVFEGYEDGPWHLYTIHRGGGDFKALTTGLFDDHDPSWSHDGTRVAFSSDRFGGVQTIWTVHVPDGAVGRASAGPGTEPCWTPNDHEVTFVRSTVTPGGARFGIWAVDAESHERLILDTSTQGAPAFPSWSPNGRQIAYELQGQLMVDSKAFTQNQDVFSQRPQWLAADQILYTANGHIQRASTVAPANTQIPFSVNLSLSRPIYTAVHRPLEPEAPQPLRGIVAPAVSPDGKAMAFVALGDLWIMPIGGVAAPVTNDPFVERDPAWSPDGTRLAFSSDRGGSMDLWVDDLRTGVQTQLSHEKAAVTGAAWSPDGLRIAYLVGGVRFTTVRISGTPTLTDGASNAVPVPGDLGRPTWAPDSRSIAIGALFPYGGPGGGGLNQLITHGFDPAVDASVLLFPERSAGNRQHSGPAWSPDGTRMAFVTEGKLWTVSVNLNGTPSDVPRVIADGYPDSPSWEGDGRHLLYLNPDGVQRIFADGSGVETVPLDLSWAPSVPPQRLTVHAGHVFGGVVDQLASDQDIVIERGVIREIAAHDDARHVGTVVDASDETVMPGLIEMHAPAALASSTAVARELLAAGVTSARLSAVNPYVGLEQREALDNGRREGPRVLMAGDPFDGQRVRDAGGITVTTEADLDEALSRATQLGADFLATRTRLGRALLRRIPPFAHAHGLAAATPEWLPGLLFGYDVVEQLPRRAYHDVIDVVGALGMTVPSALGVPVNPRQDPLTAQRVGQLKRIHDAGGRVVAASGPVRSALHDEIEQLALGGFSPLEALRAATADAAAALGVDDVLGTVEPGKLADLVFVAGDPLHDLTITRNVRRVMRGGRLYTAQQLSGQSSNSPEPPSPRRGR
jgi:Tol biopolymer transport system component